MKHPVDIHVGKRIRQQRWLSGMTQQQLAERVGIKFQQIQKYETGINRVSASRLWDISRALGVPTSFFFEGLQETDTGEPTLPDVFSDRKVLELIRSYYAVSTTRRHCLVDIAQALAETSEATLDRKSAKS